MVFHVYAASHLLCRPHVCSLVCVWWSATLRVTQRSVGCACVSADNTCSCSNGGTAATGSDCTTNNADICTACSGEFFLNGNSCDAWAAACVAGQTETQAPSNTQDRVCSGRWHAGGV